MDQGIDYLKHLIDRGSKVYKIEEKGNFIYVSVIRGVDLSLTPPDVLVSKCKINKTNELDKFLLNESQSFTLLPKDRGIILVDIAEYSRGNTLLQSAYLVSFQNALEEILSIHEMYSKGNFIEQIIPTGDGCYIVFHDSLNDRFFGVAFGIISSMHVTQNKLIKEFGRDHKSGNRIGIRVSCELGETDFFYDVSGNKNCFGIGMNEAARIQSCGHKQIEKIYPAKSDLNSIFFGENVLPQAEKLFKWLNSISPEAKLENLGALPDKHGNNREVYWIYGFSQYTAVNLFNPAELCNKEKLG